MRSATAIVTTLTLFTFLSGCASADGDGPATGDDVPGGRPDPHSRSAFRNVKKALEREAEEGQEIKTVPIQIDGSTTPSLIVTLVPPVTVHPARGDTPKRLRGVFWMRGNPLADYLLSFANFHWTQVGETRLGFLATFSPGSFAWKRKVPANKSQGNLRFVPEECRVPMNDPTLQKLAYLPATHDPDKFRRPIAEDFAEIQSGAPAAQSASPEQAQRFIQGVWDTPQLARDGGEDVQLLSRARAFYSARFNADYTESDVIVFALAGKHSVPVAVPPAVASFSFAPHLDGDGDIYVRKTFIDGLSETPNYYFLTRIVDEQGNATPHFQEFLRCVGERSQGEVLKVEFAR